MKFIDISWPITQDMTAYKDNHVVSIEHTKLFERDHVRESVLRLGAHSGTHIDAPAHFLQDGCTMQALAFDAACGRCHVIDLMRVTDGITRADLAAYPLQAGDIVLCKTTNSLLEPTANFTNNFIFLAADAAAYVVEKNIKAVGIDYLGIERGQPDHATHTILMRSGITIIEGLRLSHVQPGCYELICLPLALPGLEAAPARAVLLQKE